MNQDVAAVHAEDDVETLLRLLRDQELPGVPVVDHSDRVVGIVTESDLVIRDQDADIRLPHHIDLFGRCPLPGADQALRGPSAAGLRFHRRGHDDA